MFRISNMTSLLLGLLIHQYFLSTYGFLPSFQHKINLSFEQPPVRGGICGFQKSNKSRIILSSTDNDEVAKLRNEIEQMKLEAMAKLNNLEKATSSVVTTTMTKSKRDEFSVKDKNDSMIDGMLSRSVNDSAKLRSKKENNVGNVDTEGNFPEKIAVSNQIEQPSKATIDERALLFDSTWKLNFSIGREPNTWMPKDWGVSGERLLLNLEMTFTSQQLYEREDFLGSMGGANILQVKNNEMILSPSITEGQRKIKVLNGGWRVAQGAGPMGTDMLRFYIEIEEQISRNGSDLYCPAGRIYCNCGYFPKNRQSNGYKDRLKNQLNSMILRAEQLDEEIASEGLFSLNRFKSWTELQRLKVSMQETGERLMSASVAEPNDSILKMSQDGVVGLTKQGGVCCKVNKGIAIEYHILGRFNIASVQFRE